MSERRDIIMRRTGYHLYAIGLAEQEALMEYPEGKDFWVSIRRKRSNVHHAKYWAVLEKVWPNTKFHSASALHKAIKYELGLVKEVRLLSGKTIVEPDSIAFDKMDQAEFNLFYEAAMRLLGEYFGINPDDL